MKKNQNILGKLHQKEAKLGITRTSVDYTLGKTCKVFFIIAFAYTMAIHLLYVLSVWMNKENTINSIGLENLSVLQEDQLAQVNNSIVLVICLSALLIAGLVLLLKRVFVAALVINTLTPAVLLLHFAERMSDTLAANGLLCSYTYNHLIPLAVLLISALVFCITGIRFNRGENRAYNAFCEALYNQYSDSFEKLTDEEWDNFLSNYEPQKGKQKSRKKS